MSGFLISFQKDNMLYHVLGKLIEKDFFEVKVILI